MSNTKDLMSQIELYKYNSAAITRIALQKLREVTEGDVDIVDATNPFTYLLTSNAVNLAAFTTDNLANLRKQYATMAVTPEDLYMHMSDRDYADRFASPSRTVFSVMIDQDELEGRMVLDPQTGIRRVTMPRNTEFRVGEVAFSLQYPVDIKKLNHGGYQVTYDTSKPSPLQVLSTNRVEWRPRTLTANQQKFIYMELDVEQFSISTFTSDLNGTTGYRKRLPYRDSFYYARVYIKSNNTGNQWSEIRTTHTDQVYDASIPTAVLKVLPEGVEVYVPQVYFTTGLVSGSIRVDLYETRGEMNMVMERFKPSAFSAEFKAIDAADVTPEVAAFRALQNVFAFSTKTVSGGKNELTFEQLRNRVIMNATGPQSLPITNVQIEAALENEGFQVVKNVDVITNRLFLATRALPTPFDEKLITAGAASIETLILSMEQATQHPQTRNNGQRVTLTPEILYLNDNGIIRMVDVQTLTAVLSQTKEQIAAHVTSARYMYTPFHYVMDSTQATFDVRPYYLNRPRALSCQFVDHNDTTGFLVNTQRYSIVKRANAYVFRVETRGNQAYVDLDDSQLHAQLSFVPVSEENRCYMRESRVSRTAAGDVVFEFDITTNYDIDANDRLYLQPFQMFANLIRNYGADLTQDFDIFYSTSAPVDPLWEAHEMDGLLGRFSLPAQVYGITQERASIQFGVPLKNLWSSSRSIPASAPFQTYDTDQLAYYPEDVYETDENGISLRFENGNLVYNLLHRKGDQIFTENGDLVYSKRRGDVMVGADGRPIPIGESIVQRQMDLFFIEGAYYFATDSASATYRESIVETVVDWVTVSLANLTKNLLEQTRVFFYPKTTMGSVPVIIENAVRATVDAGQYFRVRLYVTESVYNNAALREALTVSTISSIDAQLRNSTVSISTMTSALKALYRDDVLSFQVTGLGGARNIQMLTMVDESDRLSIRKRLTALSDGKLIVQEDVVVDFAVHNPN